MGQLNIMAAIFDLEIENVPKIYKNLLDSQNTIFALYFVHGTYEGALKFRKIGLVDRYFNHIVFVKTNKIYVKGFLLKSN